VTAYGQRMLSLRDRIKPSLITITGLVLARMPGGNNIRELLRRIGKSMLMEPHLPAFNEDFDNVADSIFKVTHFKEKKRFEVPETLVIVAEAGG